MEGQGVRVEGRGNKERAEETEEQERDGSGAPIRVRAKALRVAVKRPDCAEKGRAERRSGGRYKLENPARPTGVQQNVRHVLLDLCQAARVPAGLPVRFPLRARPDSHQVVTCGRLITQLRFQAASNSRRRTETIE